jgi:recombination protein RecT
MAAIATQPQNNTVQVQPKTSKVTDLVWVEVAKRQKLGAIALPANYDAGNALNLAWLKLQTAENKDHKPVYRDGALDTSVVTEVSVKNALLDYVIQGLNVAKNQCYFIVYGNQLLCQRSYFGDMAVAERVRPGITFFYDSIRSGEQLTLKKRWSKAGGFIDHIEEHTTGFPRNDEVIGAYAGVMDNATGELIGLTIFDIVRIKKSWNMSKLYNIADPSPAGTHVKFPEEMAIRTVVRHLCKGIINASNDAELLSAIQRQDNDAIEAEVAEDAAQNANREVLQIPAPSTESKVHVIQSTGEIVGDSGNTQPEADF